MVGGKSEKLCVERARKFEDGYKFRWRKERAGQMALQSTSLPLVSLSPGKLSFHTV